MNSDSERESANNTINENAIPEFNIADMPEFNIPDLRNLHDLNNKPNIDQIIKKFINDLPKQLTEIVN